MRREAIQGTADVVGALAEPIAARSTGILTAVHGRHRRLLCLEQGWLVLAASNLVEEQVGAFLVRHGVLASAALGEAQRRAAEDGKKLARSLLDGGLVPEPTLRPAMERYAREMFRSTLAWRRAECTFRAGRPDLGGEFAVRVSCAPDLLAHVVASAVPSDQLRPKIGPPGSRFGLRSGREDGLEALAEQHDAVALLRLCDGSRDLAALTAGDDEHRRLSLLWGLRLLGLVEPVADERSRPAADSAAGRDEVLSRIARAEGADHYAILGIDARAKPTEVREAYYDLALRFHPDRFRSGPLADLLPQIESYFSKVTEAYNTLHIEPSRVAYDQQLREGRTQRAAPGERDASALARQNFVRGKELIERRRFQDALGFLENAVALDGSKPAYRVELGRVLALNPRRRIEAEQHLIEATNLDPTLVPAFLELGRLYLKLERREDAARMFRHVLRWEPAHAEASAELDALGERVGPSAGDRLRGLFRG